MITGSSNLTDAGLSRNFEFNVELRDNTDIDFASETELIIKAKEAIRKGRFQNLQRDINKLKRAVDKSPLKPVIILERIMTILKSYPLAYEEVDEIEPIKVITSKIMNPKIIITESYT